MTKRAGHRWQATGDRMRLICPNCGAQYEVPDDVIPDAGRDVQCSNCGDTWFQHHPNHEPAVADEDGEGESLDSPPDTQESEPEVEPVVEAEQDSEEAEPEAQPPEPEPQKEGPTPSRRDLDPAIADILRQEAEYEEKERAKESRGGIETQPDLGLAIEGTDERTKQVQARMARLRGTPEEDGARNEEVSTADIDPNSRRNLLPDIEEITSSLSSDDSHPVPAPVSDDIDTAPVRKSGGFMRGFLSGVLIVAVIAAIYLLAPTISAQFPAMEGAMSVYVKIVDAIRVTLNEQIGNLTNWIREMSAPVE